MKIAIILCCLLVIQNTLSFIQVRYYRKSMDSIVSHYRQKEGFYLFSGMERRKLRPGAIAMLVVDNQYNIKECYVLNGFSILSKFREIEEYKGKHVGFVLDRILEQNSYIQKSKRLPAVGSALTKAAENALLSISKNNITTI